MPLGRSMSTHVVIDQNWTVYEQSLNFVALSSFYFIIPESISVMETVYCNFVRIVFRCDEC